MQLVEIKDKNKWNEFVGAQPHAEFLQSWEWGEFLEKAEGNVRRFGVEEDGNLVAVISLVKRSLPLGMNYFYAPRGPILNYQSSIINLQTFLFFEIEKIAKKENIIFLRIEPKERIDNCKLKIVDSIAIQVSKTIILDLSLSEEDLLKKMHQKTRYNIRLAEKKGVKIKESPLLRGVAEDRGVPVNEFDKFWDLMSATVNRDGFRLHSKEYYQKMLALDQDFIKLYFGEYNGKILCAGIFCFFGDTAVYLHGASSNKNREMMAPFLLQWEMIKKAKALGLKYYDFSGIDEKKWPGVTRFKRGFSTQEINYPGTFDVIFNSLKYFIYKILRVFRRLF